MSESGDWAPAPHWRGYDFSAARADYHVHVRKSYDDAVQKKVVVDNLIPKKLVCNSETPVVFVIDVTGSMEEWPATIFSKLPYLENEGKAYLGDDVEACFIAVGDSTANDKYPLQVTEFVKGKDMESSLKKLIIEKKGGTGHHESYELPAIYLARNCKFPNAIRKPICIFFGDEGIRPHPSANAETLCKTKIDSSLTSKQAFEELRNAFNVYLIRKTYNGDRKENGEIREQWVDYLGGEDRLADLDDPKRVVDVIFGILAKETGKIDYFDKELKERQLPDKGGKQKVDVVLKSLHTIHNLDADSKKLPALDPNRVKSVTKRATSDSNLKKSVSLLDD